jgi:hypothetical protein
VRFRQRVRLCGLLPRHIESRGDRFEDILARRAELLSGNPQKRGAIVVEACVEGVTDGLE